jgi:YVTN family beta-propeller protein
MKINKGINSVALVLAALILYFIFVSFAASAATEKSTMPIGTYAYIPNDGHISVIDTATNTVIATVPVGGNEVAVTPDGTKLYVTNASLKNDVSVINTSTNSVIANVPVGTHPVGIAITPDGKKAYVTNSGPGSTSGPGILWDFDDVNTDIFVIDTATNTVIATVPLYDHTEGIAVTPDGTKVYVTDQASSNVSVIDTATNIVIATVPVEGNPVGVAVTPDGTKVYVTIFLDGIVSVINTVQNNVIANISVGGNPSGIAVTPDGKKVFVTNQNDNDVSVISTETNNVIAKIKVGNQSETFGQFIGCIPSKIDHPITNFNTNISSKGSNINTNVTVNVLQSGNITSYFEKTFEQIQRQNASSTGRKKSPGFDFVLEVVSLISLVLYKRK